MEPSLCDLVLVEVDGVTAPAIVTEVGKENEDGSWTVAVSTFHTPKLDARNFESVSLYVDRDEAVSGAEATGTPVLAYNQPA